MPVNAEMSIFLPEDLGFGLLDSFRTKFPDRFYDIGVAECDMAGIAAGLSLSGKNVYCYSIIPFLIMRTYEQIRVDIAYHNLNVKLVGGGGGLTYGFEGFTHFGLEDFALMRSLPNMSVVVPADAMEAKQLAKISYEYPSPLYIRLGRNGEPLIHEREPRFEIGKSMVLTEGKDVAIFAVGNMVYIAKKVMEKLKAGGIKPTLINMHTLKPFDTKIVNQVLSTHKVIFSMEEHYLTGGLGTAVAEIIAESSYKVVFKRFGLTELKKYIGNAEYLRTRYGLNVDSVYNKILEVLK